MLPLKGRKLSLTEDVLLWYNTESQCDTAARPLLDGIGPMTCMWAKPVSKMSFSNVSIEKCYRQVYCGQSLRDSSSLCDARGIRMSNVVLHAPEAKEKSPRDDYQDSKLGPRTHFLPPNGRMYRV